MPEPGERDWENYVERWAMLFEEAGLPRSAGRIWARLLICEPEHQSLSRLCEALELSKGTVSTSTRLLEGQGLLERAPVAGSREAHYRIPADAFEELMRRKLEVTVAWRRLAAEGAHRAREDVTVPVDRLRRLRDFYEFIEDRQRAILEEWRSESKSAVSRQGG